MSGPVGIVVFVVAMLSATTFLLAAIMGVFVIWIPVVLLSLTFGASTLSGKLQSARSGLDDD